MKKTIELVCQNPDCGKVFTTDLNHKHQKFCCKKCCTKVHNTIHTKQKLDAEREKYKDRPCENCGKQHDHTYGTGRFCSKECRYEWVGRKSGDITGHIRSAKKDWKCKYCDDIFRTRREMEKHIHTVHINEIHINRSWNKGLTKETSESVRKNGKAVSRTMKELFRTGKMKPHRWTEEERKIQSERKKKLYREHPENHPNRKLANNKKKMSYPEQVAYNWLKKNNISFEPQFNFITEKFNRYVDFYCKDKNIFIEIDGSYWHKDKQRDVEKDKDAKEHGIETYRIAASERIEDMLNKIFYGE